MYNIIFIVSLLQNLVALKPLMISNLENLIPNVNNILMETLESSAVERQ